MSSPERAPAPELVSIIVTTKDRPQLVPNAVASALNQTHPAVEVVVVDDGSAVPFHEDSGDARVRTVRSGRAHGVCSARNRGLAEARGAWVVFLDDDDRLAPGLVADSLQAAAGSTLPPPVAVLSAVQRVDAAGRPERILEPVTLPRGSDHFLEDVPGDFLTHNSLLAPASVIREMGGWDEALTTSEHDDFFLRLNAVCSLQGNPAVGYYLQGSAGPRLHEAILARAAAMERTVAKQPAAFRRHRRRGARYMASVGMTYLRAGRWGRAVAWTWRALRRDPLRIRNWVWWLAALAGPGLLRVRRRIRSSYGPSSQADTSSGA